MVKSACGIGEVYMCFNGTGIWGGETINEHVGWAIIEEVMTISPFLPLHSFLYFFGDWLLV